MTDEPDDPFDFDSMGSPSRTRTLSLGQVTASITQNAAGYVVAVSVPDTDDIRYAIIFNGSILTQSTGDTT